MSIRGQSGRKLLKLKKGEGVSCSSRPGGCVLRLGAGNSATAANVEKSEHSGSFLSIQASVSFPKEVKNNLTTLGYIPVLSARSNAVIVFYSENWVLMEITGC